MNQPGILNPASHSAKSKGSLVIAKKCPNITAPATIIITIQDVRTVSFKDLIKFLKVICRLMIPIIRVAAAPMAAASVGVKKPKNIPPITVAKIISVSDTPASDLNFIFQEERGPAGPNCGFILQLK